MEKDTSAALLGMLIQANTNSDTADHSRELVVQGLRQQFERDIASNIQIKEFREEAVLWKGTFQELAEDILSPGTIVRFIPPTYSMQLAAFYVIKDVPTMSSFYAIKIQDKMPKNLDSYKLKDNLSIRDVTIIDVSDIPEPQLRKNAEKLIAKIRLKDWQTMPPKLTKARLKVLQGLVIISTHYATCICVSYLGDGNDTFCDECHEAHCSGGLQPSDKYCLITGELRPWKAGQGIDHNGKRYSLNW